jgi:5'-3' exonuclease
LDAFLVDGTYELFRHYFAVPSALDQDGNEVGAVLGVVGSILAMLDDGVTHIGVATDHVIESFRNRLWPGYKTAAGVPEKLLGQFGALEAALEALGVKLWAMTEFEADDALASAAEKASHDPAVGRVFICSPDKDLSQCVVGDRVVQLDRRRRAVRNEAGVVERFGIRPQSIPDYLALVGDSADGFPGVSGWGEKTAAKVLHRYERLEAIPKDPAAWDVPVRGAGRLVAALDGSWDRALLFRDLATLRTTVPVFESVEELRWTGPTPEFEAVCARLQSPQLLRRTRVIAGGRQRR